MRFMIIRKADQETEAGVMPSESLIAAMMKFNEEMVQAGVMKDGDGLHPSSKGARIKFSGGKPTVIDGPFAETKELIAGFTMIQVKSKAEALEWVKRWPAEDANGNVELELRQVFEAEDFGDALTPELREAEERMREHLQNSAAQPDAKS
ncbi:PhnB protein [Collimonas arenae]|uniref:PhnB protein n=1 Tax=Collimonas arenae TaxID=279058 RepID=A0A0A1FGS4_9BURK|nr:YciI family protein [Collimonas arenae]AIY42925.1 PhnB protein [Collimonas arenae]